MPPTPTKNKAFVSTTMREKQFSIIYSLTQEDLCAFPAWFWVLGTEPWIRHSAPLLLPFWLAVRQRKHLNDWPWLHKMLRAMLALWDMKTKQDNMVMCDWEGGLAFVHNKNLCFCFYFYWALGDGMGNTCVKLCPTRKMSILTFLG